MTVSYTHLDVYKRQEQEREDQIMDQLSFKEYEDPFKDLEDM